MKFFLAFCLIVGVASAALVRPPYADTYDVMLHEAKQFDIFQSTKNVILKLVDNLRKVTKEATDAIGTFNTEINNRANQVRDKIVKDLHKLRDRVDVAIDQASDKLIDSGAGVVDCVAIAREEAATLFNTTLTKSFECVDDRIKSVASQLESLTTIVNNATDFSSKVLEDMRHCTAENGNILSINACLGNVAIRTELKVAMFATQTTLTIGRISLTLATLPASLEVCAGARLVEVGIATTQIVMEISSCSASSAYTSVTGSGSSATKPGPSGPNTGLLLALPSEDPNIIRQ